jgi:hypothetical protein
VVSVAGAVHRRAAASREDMVQLVFEAAKIGFLLL